MEGIRWIRKIRNKEENSLRYKASLTVESAFVLPFFFLTAVVLAGMLDLFRITMLVQTALCEGAKELGMYAYCTAEDENSPVGAVSRAICIAYGTKKVQDSLKGENLSQIAGGSSGITLLESAYEGEMVSLKAVYFYHIPVAFLKGIPVKIEAEAQARAWIGYKGQLHGQENMEEMVYITEWESVYHTSETCTHLDICGRETDYDNVGSLRNAWGERYHACELCHGDRAAGGKVFITETGNRYHSDEHCSGLTRHIKFIKKSEADHLRPCYRCQGGEGE